MENVELTIAVGVVILIYRRVEITVWQKDLDRPLHLRVLTRRQDHTPQDQNQVATYRRASRSSSS